MTVKAIDFANTIHGMMSPLRFTPLIKRLRWGGTRLGTCLRKPIGTAVDAAESWEIADHGTDQSVVMTGPFAGWTLARLMGRHATELLGCQAEQTTFPLLVKFLDASDRLSLQVHPNDEQAARFALTGRGKTEAWHVLQAEPGSLIFAGLKPGVSRGELDHAIRSGTLTTCVHTIEARAGDSYLIPAGTVHAIGEGVLLAEIQQTCDITFRLHDWGRLGADGRPRQLHVREALECIDFSRGPVEPLIPLPVAGNGAHQVQELVACDYFMIRRHTGSQPWQLESDDRFHIYMVLEGMVRLDSPEGSEHLSRGDTVLIPASCQTCRIVPAGTVTLLETFLP